MASSSRRFVPLLVHDSFLGKKFDIMRGRLLKSPSHIRFFKWLTPFSIPILSNVARWTVTIGSNSPILGSRLQKKMVRLRVAKAEISRDVRGWDETKLRERGVFLSLRARTARHLLSYTMQWRGRLWGCLIFSFSFFSSSFSDFLLFGFSFCRSRHTSSSFLRPADRVRRPKFSQFHPRSPPRKMLASRLARFWEAKKWVKN